MLIFIQTLRANELMFAVVSGFTLSNPTVYMRERGKDESIRAINIWREQNKYAACEPSIWCVNELLLLLLFIGHSLYLFTRISIEDHLTAWARKINAPQRTNRFRFIPMANEAMFLLSFLFFNTIWEDLFDISSYFLFFLQPWKHFFDITRNVV